jgi:hypothetical protein
MLRKTDGDRWPLRVERVNSAAISIHGAAGGQDRKFDPPKWVPDCSRSHQV